MRCSTAETVLNHLVGPSEVPRDSAANISIASTFVARFLWLTTVITVNAENPGPASIIILNTAQCTGSAAELSRSTLWRDKFNIWFARRETAPPSKSKKWLHGERTFPDPEDFVASSKRAAGGNFVELLGSKIRSFQGVLQS